MYHYKVVEFYERGGKMSAAKMETLLNEHAAQGWQLRAITSAEISAQAGFGKREGVLLTFERQA